MRSSAWLWVGAALAAGGAGGITSVAWPATDSTIDLIAPWRMHQIVIGARGAGLPDGADGVDIADINRDGLPDVVTAHEQGVRVSLSINPGPDAFTSEWPTAILGGPGSTMCSPEDAVFGDVDQDGTLDIAVACEGGKQNERVTVLFAPPDLDDIVDEEAWTRVDLTTSAFKRSMRVQIVDLAGDGAPEIVVGGKESDSVDGAATLGYYSSATPRVGASWTYTSIVPVGWIMQMLVQDFDRDGDLDIVYSDRDPINVPALDNSKRGVRWLENIGGDPPSFVPHQISRVESSHKWFTLLDWDEDGDLDIADCRSSASVNTSQILLNGGNSLSWTALPIPQPSGVGQCQHFTVEDIDQDGLLDFAFSYSNAQNRSGVAWEKRSGAALSPSVTRGEIAGILYPTGDTKFDNLAWADVDGDGDMDAITTEQHIDQPDEPPDYLKGDGPGLGVLYFENPLIP